MIDLPPMPCPGDPFHVSERQADILDLAARGLCDKEIAHHLGLAIRSVRTQLERLYVTSGRRGRTAATVAWMLSDDRARRETARALQP